MSHYSKGIRDMFRRGFSLISEGSQLVEEAYILHEEELSRIDDEKVHSVPKDNALDLRECPFCGTVPNELEWCSGERVYSAREWDTTVAVCCTNPTCETHGPFAITEEFAIELWNRSVL